MIIKIFEEKHVLSNYYTTLGLKEQLSFDAAPAFADHAYLKETRRLSKYKDARNAFLGFRCVNLSREYALNKSGM